MKTDYRMQACKSERKVPYCQQPVGSGTLSCLVVTLVAERSATLHTIHHWDINQNNSWQSDAPCVQSNSIFTLGIQVSSLMTAVEKENYFSDESFQCK